MSYAATRAVKIGTAYGTQMSVHGSWFWLAPLAIFTLIYLNVAPPIEAFFTIGLLFVSALAANLARVREASRQSLVWQKVMLFPVGSVVQRRTKSPLRAALKIETVGLLVNLSLATVFGIFFLTLPAGALRIEMEIIALYNLGLVLFALFTRRTPNHDNLLQSLFNRDKDDAPTHLVVAAINSILIGSFVIVGVAAFVISWFAFGWWFATAVMLSQLVTVAETFGDYTETLPLAQHTPAKQKAPADIIRDVPSLQ